MAEVKMTQRWQEGEWASILVSEVRRGDQLRVVMGERVPVDGIIHEGEGWIDTSTLTGEVLPRAIQKIKRSSLAIFVKKVILRCALRS